VKKPLRSNFEVGTSRWAVRRAQWRALGLTDKDMAKPKIAVVNTSSELAICFSHLDGISKVVKDAIRAAGGLPFEIRTMAPSDFIISAGRAATYILPSRDLIANSIEAQVEGAQLDGMICLASCDKTTPGQLMAAGRMNVPTLVVICGYQQSGTLDNRHVDIEEVFLHAGHVVAGKMSVEELTAESEVAIRSPGVCSGMGTANSMHSACEALGMTLPGAAPIAANSERMFDYVRRSGARIVEMIAEDLKPRDVMTAGAFRNAAATVLAVSGSINCIKHLQAIAIESGVEVDVYKLFEDLSEAVPIVAAVRPIGEDSIEAFEAAGGALGVMKQIQPCLDSDVLTVSGRTLQAVLDEAIVADEAVIRPMDHPFAVKPGIVILKGSLAPDGAIVKVGLRGAGRPLAFKGPARVFDSSPAAEEALKAGAIKSGDVIVLRGMGVKGGPGMSGASRLVFTLDGSGLGPEVAVVTDGQLSGLVNKGLVLGEVTPEAATGGPIGLVEDGDQIAIDIEARRADLLVPDDVMATRHASFRPPPPSRDSGWLSIYQRVVQPLTRGATLLEKD
jgi:dihydroxy-acid dehydratase